MDQLPLRARKTAPLHTPSDLGQQSSSDIAAALTGVLADAFALYLKTKNFHWHLSGPHFRDYHLMLDEQGGQILAMTDLLAERARKVGGTTLRSIGHIARIQRLLDNDADYVTPQNMLAELAEDNRRLTGFLRAAHTVCETYNDVASTSFIEAWIDEAEQRNWFLYEATRASR
jgi:starvation-inducible DNA-binding protein